MMSRRVAAAGLSSITLPVLSPGAWAQSVNPSVNQSITLVESIPAADSVVAGGGIEFVLRFEGPVDHAHALLVIMQGGKAVETLHARLKSALEVVFARAPKLAPGDYRLHWSVGSMASTAVVAGDVPFTVGP